MIRRPPSSTLFPSTTLSRSGPPAQAPHRRRLHRHTIRRPRTAHLRRTELNAQIARRHIRRRARRPIDLPHRRRRKSTAPHMHRHRPRPRHHTRRRQTRQHWHRRNVRHRQRRALRDHHPVLHPPIHIRPHRHRPHPRPRERHRPARHRVHLGTERLRPRHPRSEERRVGKERRSRWSPYH